MAKKSKIRHVQGKKKNKPSSTKVGPLSPASLLELELDLPIVEDALPFDKDTIELAGGDLELLKNIRNMISGMDDLQLLKCMDDIKSGNLKSNNLFDLIEESSKIINARKNSDESPDPNHVHDEQLEQNDDQGEQRGENTPPELSSKVESEEEIDSELEGKEFSFDLELGNNFFDPYKFHDAIYKVLCITDGKTDENSRIYKLFIIIATLCDPYTQPSSTGERNEMILSADLVSDLIIALVYENYVEIKNDEIINVPEFDFSYDLSIIITRILIILNSDDEDVLTSIQNNELNWENELYKWLPHNSFSNLINIASDFHHLNLLYTIVTISLLIIHKLYGATENICLNPFLSLYLQIWKNQTRIIYLGIEIDRRDEINGFPGYPEVIRYMIKGSSAIRSIISMILNDDFKRREHDLKHESLINFMRPWGRKFTNGSIKRDIRIFIASLLSLGSELDNVTELLFNFEPEDRYDEDIKYMFEMDLEDMNGEVEMNEQEYEEVGREGYNYHHKKKIKKIVGKNSIFEIEQEEDDDDSDEDEYGNFKGESGSGVAYKKGEEQYQEVERKQSNLIDLHPDCNCVFEDFESDYDYDDYGDDDDDDDDNMVDSGEEERMAVQEDNELTIKEFKDLNKHELKNLDSNSIKELHLDIVRSIQNGPSAVRNHGREEKGFIDSKGRDWRDIPRGQNVRLTDDFIELLKLSTEDSSIFITPIENLIDSMKEMTMETLASDKCEKIIQSVAWVVQYEYESKQMTIDELKEKNNDETINADRIYNFLKIDNNFNKMVEFNPSSTFSIVDELLMCEGYRRVLIWFLTHLSLNQWLINYFHDLLCGLRGNVDGDSNKDTRFKYSRVGGLELSEIEKSMLLHEFFSNAVIYLSRGSSNEFEEMIESDMKGGEGGEGEGEGKEDDEKEYNEVAQFIANRSNAQKLIKIICLMIKSLEKYKVLNVKNYCEYKIEIQTLLVQWVGVGFVPEARELFFKYSRIKEGEEEDEEKAVEEKAEEEREYLRDNQIYRLTNTLKNFKREEILMILLNMAVNYNTERNKCYEFMKDLNSISNVYYDDEKLLKSCDELFEPLNKLIEETKEKEKKSNYKEIVKIFEKFKVSFGGSKNSEEIENLIDEFFNNC